MKQTYYLLDLRTMKFVAEQVMCCDQCAQAVNLQLFKLSAAAQWIPSQGQA